MRRALFQKQAPQGAISLMYRVYKHILPCVSEELQKLHQQALLIPDKELQAQALSSLRDKRFHCQGGAVFAALCMEYKSILIPLITALQTISDYLDNLCDRSTSLDACDFRLLHQSMLDAVTPGAKPGDYYAYRDEKDDGGYLHHLVNQCQQQIVRLPSYSVVQAQVTELVVLYSDLQVYKHIHKELREDALLQWSKPYQNKYPQLLWNEFAAASGSTLAMFLLFTAACDAQLTQADADLWRESYFPHVCSLHILLDYLIDQEEDTHGGDLNFCNYYESDGQLINRMEQIVTNARSDVKHLPAAHFHSLIIEGLLALYLSDPKVRSQSEVRRISEQLMRNSKLSRLLFFINSRWIRFRKL